MLYISFTINHLGNKSNTKILYCMQEKTMRHYLCNNPIIAQQWSHCLKRCAIWQQYIFN